MYWSILILAPYQYTVVVYNQLVHRYQVLYLEVGVPRLSHADRANDNAAARRKGFETRSAR